MLGVAPPVYPNGTGPPAQFPLHWASPHAAQQFVVIVILIALVLAFWLSCRKKDEPDG